MKNEEFREKANKTDATEGTPTMINGVIMLKNLGHTYPEASGDTTPKPGGTSDGLTLTIGLGSNVNLIPTAVQSLLHSIRDLQRRNGEKSSA